MKFWNFFKAWIRYKGARLLGYKTLADPKTASDRFDICLVCPLFNGAECEKCGCLAMAKTMIAVEKCPTGQWDAVWAKRN